MNPLETILGSGFYLFSLTSSHKEQGYVLSRTKMKSPVANTRWSCYVLID